jgi:N-carbamoyl-L-amino-acid hydrolase
VRSLDAIRVLRDAQGVALGEALDALHAAFPALPRLPLGREFAFCIEPHIEQATRLEEAGVPIGVVTGIQGKITWEVVLRGEEGHAGTLDMAKRRDAVMGFARLAARMQREVGEADPLVKFTIGMVRVQPNAPSVIAGRVVFRIDLRHPDNAALERHGARLEAITAAEAPPCGVTVTRLVHAPSNGFDPGLRAHLAAAAGRLGLAHMDLLSAAGHDARHMAPRCPTAMLFIPCRGGISHSPLEWAAPEHVDAGAAVLAEAVRELCA